MVPHLGKHLGADAGAMNVEKQGFGIPKISAIQGSLNIRKGLVVEFININPFSSPSWRYTALAQ